MVTPVMPPVVPKFGPGSAKWHSFVTDVAFNAAKPRSAGVRLGDTGTSVPVSTFALGLYKRPVGINTNQATSNVTLQSGETLLLGGFQSSSQVEEKNQTPLLGSISVLGKLVGNRTVKRGLPQRSKTQS